MAVIQTYVFLDTETTGLPTRQHGVPGVTELGMLAIKRKHLLERKANEELRVQYKLLMSFNPGKKMSDMSVKLSGLKNQLLKQEGHFNINAFNTINSFINCLQKPVCLIAHNGLAYHFPILKYYFAKMGKGVQLSPKLKCTDSLYGFYDLLEAENFGNMSYIYDGDDTDNDDDDSDNDDDDTDNDDDDTSQEMSYSRLNRTRFYKWNGPPEDSYVLKNIYQRVVDGVHMETNRAENHCVMMLKIASGRAKRFVQWVDANHCHFSEVPSEPVPQN